MSPQAVRIKTSSGWQDIALQGAQGPPGATPSARAYGTFSFAGADAYHRTYVPGVTVHFNSMGGNPFSGGCCFTAPKTGRYLLIFTVEQFTAGAAHYMGVGLLKNDATLLRSLNQATSPSSDANPYRGGVQTMWLGDLNVNDVVKLQAWSHAGANAILVIEAILLDDPSIPRDPVPGWTAVSTFSNGWTNYGAGYPTAGYYKDREVVRLKGLIRPGTISQTAFNLPTGFRPADFLHLPAGVDDGAAGSGNTRAIVRISQAGDVIPHSSGVTAGWYSLDGVSFRTSSTWL